MKIRNYLQNCFLLIIPILVWNIIFIDYLPGIYHSDVSLKVVPFYITIAENILRAFLFTLPVFMVFSLKETIQKFGLLVYVVGVLIYFLSWLIVIIYPESYWAKSKLGFIAPAYTPVIFFTGIAFIGKRAFFKFKYLTHLYISLSILFTIFHVSHLLIIFRG